MLKSPIVAKVKFILLSLLLIAFAGCAAKSEKLNPNAALLANTHRQDATGLIWSPDGQYIALSYYHYSQKVTDLYSAVYLLNVDTRENQLLFKDVTSKVAQSWSPNGEEFLFYSSGGDFSQGIWKARLNESTSPIFLNEGRYSAWSRSGIIAILSMNNQDLVLRILSPDSHEDNIVFRDIGFVIDGLSWSPDNERLVLSLKNGDQDNDYHLFVIDLKRKTLNQITTAGPNHRPSWSPMADMIVYEKLVPGENDYSLFLTNAEGTCEVQIPGTTGAFSPSWSPNGKAIAFIKLSGKIYLLDLPKVFGVDFPTKGLVCSN
jgi:Tol biopolymer transport system component